MDVLPGIVGCVGCCEGFKGVTVVCSKVCSDVRVGSYLEAIEGVADGTCDGDSKGAKCSTFVVSVAESAGVCRNGGDEGCVWWKVVVVGVGDESEEECISRFCGFEEWGGPGGWIAWWWLAVLVLVVQYICPDEMSNGWLCAVSVDGAHGLSV